MGSIAILVPSRGRPDKFKRLVNSIVETSSEDISIYCYLDSDDSKAKEYESFSQVNYTTGDPISISKSWNIIAAKAYDEGASVFIMGNDDVIYQTPQWNEILRKHLSELSHRYFCCWFRDGIKNERHATFPVLTREWYELLGHRFTPGIFHHQFNDTWIFDIAKKANVCHYIEEIFTPHLHYVRGEELDDTYIRVLQNNYMELDRQIFLNNEPERVALAQKILNECSNL